jgi:hypothetical protein
MREGMGTKIINLNLVNSTAHNRSTSKECSQRGAQSEKALINITVPVPYPKKNLPPLSITHTHTHFSLVSFIHSFTALLSPHHRDVFSPFVRERFRLFYFIFIEQIESAFCERRVSALSISMACEMR